MSWEVYKTEWVPDYGRAFILCAIDRLPKGERGGESFVVKFNLQGGFIGNDRTIYSYKLPDELFSDSHLLNQMADLALNRVGLEIDKCWLENQRDRCLGRLKLQPSNLPELIVALMLADQRKILIQIENESQSESLSTELNKFISVHDSFAKQEK